jgi:tellurite resistance protein TehA-like permease
MGDRRQAEVLLFQVLTFKLVGAAPKNPLSKVTSTILHPAIYTIVISTMGGQIGGYTVAFFCPLCGCGSTITDLYRTVKRR